jgi:hypothetical protein
MRTIGSGPKVLASPADHRGHFDWFLDLGHGRRIKRVHETTVGYRMRDASIASGKDSIGKAHNTNLTNAVVNPHQSCRASRQGKLADVVWSTRNQMKGVEDLI